MSNLKEIISSIEQAMPYIPRDRMEDACQETCHILNQKRNISKAGGKKKLLSLHNKKDIMTPLAD
jgi:hypothetical protein